MPMHDWTRVRLGTYHNFHLRWIGAIMDLLNSGLLPEGYYAMAEQVVGRPIPDLIALQTDFNRPKSEGSLLVPPKPKASFVLPVPTEAQRYAQIANRIAVHHEYGDVVAVIELVSPGNKDGKGAIAALVNKSVELISSDVNLLLVDPFPPGPRDPRGIHPLIWDEFLVIPFELPEGKPLTMASYQVRPERIAYVEPIGVGDPLPVMPLFLQDDFYVDLPLEETYMSTWKTMPSIVKEPLERS